MHQTLAPRAWIGQRVFPRQAQCADDGFFLEKIEGRYPLNPLTWIEHVYVPFQPTLEPFEPDTQVNGVDWKRVELAIDTWRTSKGAWPRACRSASRSADTVYF